MLLRYHWSLGVGHTYSHVRAQGEPTGNSGSLHLATRGSGAKSPSGSSELLSGTASPTVDVEAASSSPISSPTQTTGHSSALEEYDEHDAELSLADQDTLEWEELDDGGSTDIEEDLEESNNDIMAMYEIKLCPPAYATEHCH
ncbi:hypothetical protein HYDPIDRAFT_30615 [Hydnomerulius pinastri MD-312]|uniref:Uncharacterized protein n=1 Tax=Hydnomerulius pinastri MD-312 TaxID=994086 RepID=A0A0C9W5N9_9AGAM|nr:hypothetical protein HYDPIDRAFT_30615 [Hydnomerulius pinastri MD-312]